MDIKQLTAVFINLERFFSFCQNPVDSAGYLCIGIAMCLQ